MGAERARRPHPGDSFWISLRSKARLLLGLTIVHAFIMMTLPMWASKLFGDGFKPDVLAQLDVSDPHVVLMPVFVNWSCRIAPCISLLVAALVYLRPQSCARLLMVYVVGLTFSGALNVFLITFLARSVFPAFLLVPSYSFIAATAILAILDALALIQTQVGWEALSRRIDARAAQIPTALAMDFNAAPPPTLPASSSISSSSSTSFSASHSHNHGHSHSHGPGSAACAHNHGSMATGPGNATTSTTTTSSSSPFSSIASHDYEDEGPLSSSGMRRLRVVTADDPFLVMFRLLAVNIPLWGPGLHTAIGSRLRTHVD